jgi:sugar phosphate isomerase/epimerase
MREQDNHFHADTRYGETGLPDFINLYKNIVEVERAGGLSLNVHLPFEIQHPTVFKNYQRGAAMIYVGEQMKQLFGVKLVWENAPLLNVGTWDLAQGQSKWGLVPRSIDLCLDTGHLMLGAESIEQARSRIRFILGERGDQIQHLHIHENGLKSDDHLQIGNVIDEELFIELTQGGRTFIFEEPS